MKESNEMRKWKVEKKWLKKVYKVLFLDEIMEWRFLDSKIMGFIKEFLSVF